jgi:hypothetical protein
VFSWALFAFRLSRSSRAGYGKVCTLYFETFGGVKRENSGRLGVLFIFLFYFIFCRGGKGKGGVKKFLTIDVMIFSVQPIRQLSSAQQLSKSAAVLTGEKDRLILNY